MGNPLSRFFGFISNPSYSRTTGLLVILVIALSIPLTVFVAQKQQEIRQQAAFDQLDPGTGGGNNLKPACTGVCTGVQTCHLVEGGRVDTSMTCKTGACCVVGSSLKVTCEGDCIGEDFYKGQEIAKGTCQTNQVCVKKSSGTSTPTNQCASQGGRCEFSDLCRSDETEAFGVTCPGSSQICCKPKAGTGGTPTCPGSGKPSSGWGGSCSPEGNTDKLSISSGVCSVVGCQRYTNGALCWYNGGQVYNDPSSCPTTGGTTPTAPPPSPPPPPIGGTTCGAPYSGSCTQLNARQEPTCTKSSGASGKSVKVCQQVGSSLCWYDQYTDTNKTQAERDAGCYATLGTQLTFTIGLDGIGTTGDFRSTNSSGSNKNPRRASRKLFYQVFTPGIKEEKAGETTIQYDQSSGKFKATVDLGKTLANGDYIVKVRAEGYLAKVVRKNTQFPTAEAAVTVAGPSADVALVNLHVGDINLDRNINALDHDILISCWGVRTSDPAKCSSNSSFRTMADLDDDGKIDQFDYNLLLREFPAPVED